MGMREEGLVIIKVEKLKTQYHIPSPFVHISNCANI